MQQESEKNTWSARNIREKEEELKEEFEKQSPKQKIKQKYAQEKNNGHIMI